MRKALTEKIIELLEGLVYPDDNTTVFGVVKKLYLDFPANQPACQVIMTHNRIDTLGIDYDVRIHSYDITVYELIESNSDENALERKLSRIQDIEDLIYDLFEKEPNRVGFIGTERVHRIELGEAIYSYEGSDRGIRLFFTLPINFYTDKNVKNI